MAEYELKPCPFCGDKPLVWKTKHRTYVECTNLTKDGHRMMFSGGTYKEAIEEWNRRAADVVEVVRCKDCKYFIGEHKNGQGVCCCGNKDTNYNAEFKPYADDFCSYGERKENE